MIFQIKKQSYYSTITEKTKISFYLYVKEYENEWGKIISIFDDEETAKQVLNNIKDIYPDRERNEFIAYEEGKDIVKIISENKLNLKNLTVEKEYAIFHNYKCKEIVIDDLSKAIEMANVIIKNLKKSREIDSLIPELIYEVKITKDHTTNG